MACKYDKPVRIGVNWGSLDQSVLARIMDENAGRAVPRDAMAVMREALVTSALESAAKAEEYGLARQDHPVGQGQQRAGPDRGVSRHGRQSATTRCTSASPRPAWARRASSASTAALAGAAPGGHRRHHPRLLTPEPNGSRTQESWSPRRSCRPWACAPSADGHRLPGLRRTTSTLFQEMASDVQNFVRDNMPVWREQFDGVENMTLAVMGCIVNGRASKRQHRHLAAGHRRIPGAGLRGRRQDPTLRGDNITNEFKAIIETTWPVLIPERRAGLSRADQNNKGNHEQDPPGRARMNDILPDDAEVWEQFEDIVRDWLHSYGYRPIRMPIVEPTPLFKRAIGEVTDIVEKEMYSFEDALNGEHLTLRPKAPPPACVRRSSTTCCSAARGVCITTARCSATSAPEGPLTASSTRSASRPSASTALISTPSTS